MSKIKKIIASMLTISMFLPNIAYAGEIVDSEALTDGIESAVSYGLDKAQNILNEMIFDNEIPDTEIEMEQDVDEFQDPGMDLTQKDIQHLYDMGYELIDIEEAIKLSSIYEKTPYELLQLKGKTKYIPNAIETVSYSDDSNNNVENSEETTDYEFTKDETSWENVVLGLNEGNVIIDENQWEFIKLSGLDKYIDETMLSDEEKTILESIDLNSNNEENIETYASTEDTSVEDTYNDYIFPKSVHEQINQGGYINSDNVYVNELTGDVTVKETDISLKGRNGLDLDLTRYYSVTDSNDCDASVYKQSGTDTDTTKSYYTVYGTPEVTIYYNEPLADGSTKKTFPINSVYIVPERINYNKAPKFKYGMFVNDEVYDADVAALKSGHAPQYLFTDRTAAQKCVTYAEDGRYNYTISLNSRHSKIERIEYDLTMDTFQVLSLGSYKVKVDGNLYYNSLVESAHSRYFDIGVGWSFDFPYIEKRYGKTEDVTYEYLHMGSEGVWQIDDTELVGYYLNDKQLSYGNGKYNNGTVDYVLTEKTGKKYYFGLNGQLLGIEDRYGNNILFEYETEKYGKFMYSKLTKITDSVGRVIDITYSGDTKVIITVTDKNNSSNNRTIEYGKESGKLVSVKNAEGYITRYEYERHTTETSMVSKDSDHPSEINYDTLVHIYYPTGAVRELAYNIMKKNCGIGGTMGIPICFSNSMMEEDDDGYLSYKSSESYGRDTGGSNASATYDGYPTFRGLEEVPAEYRVSASHTYRYDYYNAVPRYSYSVYNLSSNKNWLKESLVTECEDYRNDDDPPTLYKSVTEYKYNSQELCTKETTRTYKDFDNDKNSYVETSKEYTYDSAKYGDLLSEKINGEADRTTSYTYDTTYHLPTKVSYKKDSGTTVATNYTLTSDKKSVATETVTENNSTKRKKTYTYDSYGNVISEKRYSGSNSWNDYMEITYNYTDSGSGTNKLNGAYINKISVSGIKDADGSTANGGIISQSYTYDWFGNVMSETDANGNKYQYTYDKINRITKVTNPDSSTKEYTFTVNKDANDVVVKDENGGKIRYSYNEFGESISETDIVKNVLLAEHTINDDDYNYTRNDIQYSTENGKIISQKSYNGLGEIVGEHILDADGNNLYHSVTDYEYATDGVFRKVIKTIYGDTDNDTVKNIQYIDKYGNVVKEEVQYKENGVNNSAVTTYTYDYLGNVKTVREPRAEAENWTASQYTAQYNYDVDGNVIKETDVNGKSIENTYDGLGNLITVKDKNGNVTTNTYDNLGRLIQEQIPFQKNGTSTVYSTNKYYYDGNGNITKSQTANNAVGSSASYTTTEYTYNWQNQPTKVSAFDGSDVADCVQYYYDSVGNVLRMYTGDVDALKITGLDKVSGSSNYAVTKYAYDSMNRCTSQTDALGQKVTNTYDINGNLLKTVDRNGYTLTYNYDGLNQLTQKSSSKSSDDTYTYTYNMKGNRTSMTGGGVTTTSTYDSLGRLIKESLTDGSVKEYNYDINGNRKSFKLTKNGTVQYTLTYDYDKMNQLTKVYENGAVKAEYTYNPDGTLKKSSYGSQTADYSYNLASLLTEVNNANGSTQISKYSYTYYVDGNQKSKTESVAGVSKGTTNYTYDGVNRLVKEQTPDNTYSYQYDIYGNRSQLNVTGDENYTTSYTYDKNNRLTNQTKTLKEASETTDFWYDPNGNQISSMTITTGGGWNPPSMGVEPAGGDTNSYSEYDSWNQLTKTMQNGKTASYTYNGDGLRMSKTVDGVTTSHIWDGTNIVGDVTNGTVTKYIRGLQLISSKTGSSENFYNFNGHGDVVQLTNGSGSITKQYSYDAFGVETNKADNDTNPFRYCGEYYDTETNNVYLRARYYRPTTGRFLTEDSYWNVDNMIYENSDDKKPNINAIIQSSSLYIYCNSNPILMIDPDGKKYVVDSVARWIWQQGAERYLRNRKGWYLTATLLELSTYGSGQYFEAHNGEYAADLIKYDSGFRKQVNDYLWSNGTQYDYSYTIFAFTYAFDVSGGDLGAALHNVSVIVTAERNSDASWNTFIQVYDTFDFTEFRNPFLEDNLKSMFLWTMNDLAYLDQAMNVIEPVEVYIDFYDTY